MGGSLDGYVFYSEDLEEIKNNWNVMVEDDLYENGHSYSGSIGMLGEGFDISDKVAKDAEEAWDMLAELHNKWNNALAIKIDEGHRIGYLVGGWCSS